MRKFLDIDNCIIINDAFRIQQIPAQKKTNTKRQLSKQIYKSGLMPDSSESSIYTKLYRFEKEGYINEPTDLISAVLTTLVISKENLIKDFVEETAIIPEVEK